MKSDFAIVDIKAGRARLRKYFEPLRVRVRGAVDSPRPIPATLIGEITGVHGPDDGVSQAFEMRVGYLKVPSPGMPGIAQVPRQTLRDLVLLLRAEAQSPAAKRFAEQIAKTYLIA